MAYACVRRSLQCEDGHTLCFEECPLMYILRVLVNMLCWYIKRQEWTVVTHPVNHPLQVHQPALRVSEMLYYVTGDRLPRAWTKSQTSWLRRKRWTGDVNLHLRLAPWRMVTALY